jgi:hypothetical protein
MSPQVGQNDGKMQARITATEAEGLSRGQPGAVDICALDVVSN